MASPQVLDRLALVADTHAYEAGLPQLLQFFQHRGIRHLACLGDCLPEPFRAWLEMDASHRLYWVYDVFGPQMPEATACGEALELEERIFLAHTRAFLWTHFKDQVHAYQQGRATARPPMLLCHGHTHVPAVARFSPPFNRILYINDALRPQEFQARQACLTLDPDTVYLIVPGAFTLEEGRYPTFSFAVLDTASSRIAMVSLKDLPALNSLDLFP
ncbi:MAG: metallophosphoesterase family protein [Thermodesulfobacteriota bacterium]